MANYNSQKRQYKTAKELLVEKTVLEIKQGVRVLVLMRGLPGSGKTFLAKEILKQGLGSTDYNTFIYSTDDFFTNPRTGQYNFDARKLSEAHNYNKMRAINSMAAGVSPVIIDNTNTQIWEMEPYAQAAIRYHYFIEIVEPYTKWAFKIPELARRNSHGVSATTLQHMLDRYDKSVTVDSLLRAIGVSYTGPPVYRLFPPLFDVPSINSATVPLQTVQSQNTNRIESKSVPSKEEVIYVSDEESQQENTVPNTYSPGKHNLNTALNTSESDMKKARTSNRFAEKMPNRNPSEIQSSRNFYPQLNLSSWGLSETAVSSWESWEIANPLKGSKELEDEILLVDIASSNIKESLNAATNTCSSDFALLATNSLPIQYKVLIPYNRDINEGVCVNPYPSSPPKRTVLHKSSMTDDNLIIEEAVTPHPDKQVTDLACLFPNIPLEYLRDIYEKCRGDVNWTVDLLLDDLKEILPVENTVPQNEKSPTDGTLQDNMQDLRITNESPVQATPIKKNTFNNNMTALQKHIENAIEFGKHCYSEHVLKLKNQRQTFLIDHLDTAAASTSEIRAASTPEDLNESSTSKITSILISDSESEPDIDFPDNESDNEEIIELNLNENIISQLETKLGFEEVMPQGFLPIVQLPISVARQFYAIYVESVLAQIELQNQVLDTIVKQDEEFALKLQQQEHELGKSNVEIPGLDEIMNEQEACNIYQKQTAQWKRETPDNLAARMTIQKLITGFPSIKAQTLMEIYQAYNNSYDETVEVLLASSNHSLIHDPDGTLKEPPITEIVVKEMKEAEIELKHCTDTPDVSKSAQEYRDEATLHHSKHNELIQKAIQAYQRKQFPVAQFYSDLAKTHTQLYDQANNLAASAFLNEHAKKLQNFYTLDLHFLYVKEAIAALDMFIDQNIRLLNNHKSTENLFVITGRGKRSEQGKSKLKPVIMVRLRKRKIRYWELNPGLLKIRITLTSSLTSDI